MSRSWWRGIRPCIVLCLMSSWGAVAGTTVRVSVAGAGTQVGGDSDVPSISADGRFIAFVSTASKLVAGDTNGCQDVFVRDTVAGTTVRVSVNSAGVQADTPSYSPQISADGRYVVFMSGASNLVPNDSSWYNDVYLRDLTSGQTTLVSQSSTGEQGNDDSYSPCISANGRYVAFVSMANNLVPGDGNGMTDIFVRDLWLGQTSLVSLNTAGAQGNDWSFDPTISGDGRRVAFTSYATNLVTGDTNDWLDIFVRDRVAGTTVRANVSSAGVQANCEGLRPRISKDGRYVAFESTANNLVANDTNSEPDAFLRDLTTGATTRVSLSDSGAQSPLTNGKPVVSADGRFVAFASDSALVSGDTNLRTDVYLRDRLLNRTTRISVATGGAQGNGASSTPVITPDGRYIAFVSEASTLVAGDTNGTYDVFRHDRGNFPAPKVSAWSPKGTAVARGSNITATFSLRMLKKSAQEAMTINGVKASTFGGAFIWVDRKMIFNPTTLLRPARTYKIVIGTGARSADGTRIAKAFTWSFTTVSTTAALTATAVPTVSGAQVTVSLASAAEVTVTIRNMAGRTVAALQPGELEAGVHALAWDGRSAGGTKAPAGVYVVQVTARAEDGSCRSALTTLRK